MNYIIKKNVFFHHEKIFYPNVVSCSNGEQFYPVREKIMSLNMINRKEKNFKFLKIDRFKMRGYFFFFIYNTDNYFHFVYDTLPYLLTYLDLRRKYPNIKLLMNHPNSEKKENYKFVDEFLELLDIDKSEIQIVDHTQEYETLFISDSYTHIENTDYPNPLYKNIYDVISQKIPINESFTKKIYVSRRTWTHKNTSNIGTDYTTRRKMVNEDELVEILVKEYGYVEVFTENMNTVEKISMFKSAESVVGAIGGGLCNVLFSKPETKLLALVSPTFLDVNHRFTHCLSNVDTKYYFNSKHVDTGKWKRYMRVEFGELIGEIEQIDDDKLTISYVDEFISGWTKNRKYKNVTLDQSLCRPLDKGLNSPWSIEIDGMKKYL